MSVLGRNCHKEERHAYYIGETARTTYDREAGHLSAMRKGNRESPMVEHDEEFQGVWSQS